jgi:hypothetical protein
MSRTEVRVPKNMFIIMPEPVVPRPNDPDDVGSAIIIPEPAPRNDTNEAAQESPGSE